MHISKLARGRKVCVVFFFFFPPLSDAQGFKIEMQRCVLGTGCRSHRGLMLCIVEVSLWRCRGRSWVAGTVSE